MKDDQTNIAYLVTAPNIATFSPRYSARILDLPSPRWYVRFWRWLVRGVIRCAPCGRVKRLT